MDTRRDFIKKASLLAGGAGLHHVLPASLLKALLIDPVPGSTYLDAEHIVFLMQENRSFDHTYGTLRGVRGFNDPRAITIPGNNLVWLQKNKEGETYAPFRFDIKGTKITWMKSLPHTWPNQVDARNNGKHNGWLDSKHSSIKDYAAMPLTMGHYTRADIPFYYSLADAFTVCDQHFCSSLTGTTTNRLFFWTGTNREAQDEHAMAHLWNEDTTPDNQASWKTFPERLEENGIPWKIYQNELSLDIEFSDDEDRWLSNFGCNPMECFTQYHVKFHPEYIAALPKIAERLNKALQRLQNLLSQTTDDKASQKLTTQIAQLKKRITTVEEERKNYTPEKFQQLSEYEKNIHRKAFVTNRNDPHYHELSSLTYTDNGEERKFNVPKGDILHQFRQDVQTGNLPTVSWLVPPESFSDHPASPWYGAWYISEVMDILTKNPEVWKKTIFILTYDENDGYYDHAAPFVAPHPRDRSTGFTSKNIYTGVDYITTPDQQFMKEHTRESSIGLGYRVPMVIVSPWSRGGWVNSQVFDHTSSLQFLETFLNKKFVKKIKEENISDWRRATCGDLTSAFRPYNGEKINYPDFLKRDEFLESIHQAQFKNPPSNYTLLSKEQIEQINRNPKASHLMPVQEHGIRPACALPYELYADGNINDGKFEISLAAGNKLFGAPSSGSPFLVYAPGMHKGEDVRSWAYAVEAGEQLHDSWNLDDFENGKLHLRVYGPNGFYREFKEAQSDGAIKVVCDYEQVNHKPTGNIRLTLTNKSSLPCSIIVANNSYHSAKSEHLIKSETKIVINTKASYGWYDFSVRMNNHPEFERRYAGRVETGLPGKTDPLIGASV